MTGNLIAKGLSGFARLSASSSYSFKDKAMVFIGLSEPEAAIPLKQTGPGTHSLGGSNFMNASPC